MDTVQTPPSTLIPAEYNPRKMSAKEKAYIRKSLELFGFVQPVLVNQFPGRENRIIAGHQRVKVAIEMSLESVPCWFVSLDPEKEKEANVRLNRAHASWDFQALADLADLETLQDWGFTSHELGLQVEIEGLQEMVKSDKKQQTQSDGIPIFIVLSPEENDTLESWKARIGNRDDRESIIEALKAALQ